MVVNATVPTGASTRTDRDERAFALCAVHQLTHQQRIALSPLVEFGRYVAQLHSPAGSSWLTGMPE
jgi:hypothetical protein